MNKKRPSFQELLRSKQRVLEAASERGLLQKALLRPKDPPGAQVTGPYPNTDNQYPVECGPMTKEQIEQVPVRCKPWWKLQSLNIFKQMFWVQPLINGGAVEGPVYHPHWSRVVPETSLSKHSDTFQTFINQNHIVPFSHYSSLQTISTRRSPECLTLPGKHEKIH